MDNKTLAEKIVEQIYELKEMLDKNKKDNNNLSGVIECIEQVKHSLSEKLTCESYFVALYNSLALQKTYLTVLGCLYCNKKDRLEDAMNFFKETMDNAYSHTKELIKENEK